MSAPAPLRARVAGPLLLVITAVLWSLSGVLVKSIAWHPMALAGARSVLAIPVILLFTGRPRWRFTPVQLGGAVAYSATMIFFILATTLTSAANAIFLQYTAPIYVAVLSPLWLGEKALRSDRFLIPLALGGIALFFLDGLSASGWWGNVFGLGSGLAFAGTALCLRKAKDSSPATIILLGNILTALLAMPYLMRGGFPLEKFPLLLVLGLLQLGLAYGLYSVAIQRVTALEATLLPLLEPILNPVWVMLALGEKPGGWALTGAAVVLLAVMVRGILMVLTRPAPRAHEPTLLDERAH